MKLTESTTCHPEFTARNLPLGGLFLVERCSPFTPPEMVAAIVVSISPGSSNRKARCLTGKSGTFVLTSTQEVFPITIDEIKYTRYVK